jgi:MtrB/PioB family decaheme-associated outer membrane protein
MALAMLGVFGPAWADDAAVAELSKPDVAYVDVGAAGVSGDSKDRSLFGQYNGLRKDDAYLMLDFDYVKRDDATGTWTIVEGRNLGLTTREVRALYGPQGNWKIYGEYWELTRYYPRTVNSSIQGAGTTTPTITLLPVPGTGSDIDLKTERKRATVGGEKWFGPHLMIEASFINEDKDGARLWGRGFTCPSGAAPTPTCTALATGANQWALLMVPEPISSTTRQIEAKVNYLGDKFTLIGGYYGSFYDNDFGSLVPTVNGNLNNGLGVPMGTSGGVALTQGLRNILQLPMALPPDNQAHQFYVDGNYAFTNTTRATFKYAYTRATQNESFSSMGLTGAPPGRSDLGGRLDTTLAQAGVTSRPIPRLSLLANVRYEDQNDKTPIDLYNIEGTNTWTNGHISHTKSSGKIEASYALPYDLRGTIGFDFEKVDRDQFVQTDQVAGLSALRQNTYERGWRVELRKTMSDNFTGSVSWVTSDRTGSTWLKPLSGASTGVIPADPDCTSATVGGVPNACIYSRTGIFPFIFEDRKRDKVRALADWSPMDKLSLQFSVDYGKDDYTGPTEKGLDHTKLQLYGVDLAYQLSDAVKLTAYYSYSEQTLKVSHSTGYIGDLKDKNNTSGIGIIAQANPRLKLTGDIMFIRDQNIYGTGLDSLATAATQAQFNTGQLFIPDATFRDLRLKLTGTYALQKNSDIRMEIVHDRTKLEEWQWGWNGVPFLYSDNTTVNLKPEQNVTYVSLIYTYRWK